MKNVLAMQMMFFIINNFVFVSSGKGYIDVFKTTTMLPHLPKFVKSELYIHAISDIRIIKIKFLIAGKKVLK